MADRIPSVALDLLKYFSMLLTVSGVLVLVVSSFVELVRIVLASYRRKQPVLTSLTGSLAPKIAFALEFLIIAIALEILIAPGYLALAKLAVFVLVRTALGYVKL